jgi:SAM-dependent methyltransferase
MPQTLLQQAQTLNTSMEALAALGALLTVRRDQLQPDPRVKDLLDKVAATIDPALLTATTPQEEAVTLGFIRSFFRLALDLLDNPDRAPGWSHSDPVILQSIGIGSRQIVHTLAKLAGEVEWLNRQLNGGGTFLDIGTGVGMLAIEAAKTWHDLKVVGIDTYPTALNLARENLARSDVGGRVELRQQSVEHLDPAEHFDVAWFPGPFIPLELVEPSLALLRRVLVRDGALVFGFFGAPNPLAQALTDLRVVRGGGYPWTGPAVKELLQRAGYLDVQVFAEGSLATLVVGRNPG